MTFVNSIGCILVLAGALTGCRKPGEPASGLEASPAEPRQAQPRLQTLNLWLGAEELTAELALTAEQQITGMMFRTHIAENEGMLFVHPTPRQAAYWMKNCAVPLSIAYISSDGVIQEIHDLQPHDTNAVVSTATNVRFALETGRGWFQRHKIHPGMVVRTERGSLMETFFSRRQGNVP